MMDNHDALLVLRGHLLTGVFAGTGVTTLTSTGNGYTRVAGSFIMDGFVPGMEVVPAGFADNTPQILKSVTDTQLTIWGENDIESGPGRSLTVGIPPHRSWENVNFKPLDNRWYIEEDYLPSPAQRVNVSKRGQYHYQPTYVLRLAGLPGRGSKALYRVSDGILRLFSPGLDLTMSDGHPLRVRTDITPYPGQLVPEETSHAVIVITIPLWKRTVNS